MVVEQIKNTESLEPFIELFVKKHKSNEAISNTMNVQRIKQKLDEVIHYGITFILRDGERVLGFLANYLVKEMFYKQKGVYTPEYGCVVLDDNPLYIEKLFTHLYQFMKEQGYTHHGISDINEQYNPKFLQMGYGLRVVDGVTEVKNVNIDSRYTLHKATIEDAEVLYPIYQEHESYMASSPIFLDSSSSLEELKEDILSEDEIYLFYEENKLIGYTTINQQEPCGCYVFFDKEAISIKGTHIKKSLQGKGYGRILVDLLHQKTKQLGKAKLVTDFEIFNTPASTFWPKHFHVVAHSYVRYIG